MRSLLALLAVAGVATAHAADVSRFVSSEADFAVNSWLVPTRHGLVVIDTQFTVTEADKLVAAVRQSGRPLQAIIITHPHPDHYNGTCQLLALARVPVYSTQATVDGIRATAEAKRAQWKPTYGRDYPDMTCVPDHVVPNGARVRIDGLDLRLFDYGPGEASVESIVLVPAIRGAFVGDVIYDQIHPWLAEGRSARWLAQLDRLKKDVPTAWTVYPGHGPSADVTVIEAQRQYITGFRATVEAQRSQSGNPSGNASRLTPESVKAIVESVRAHYPGWPLEMLIPINAEAVSNESNDAEKH
jgi:glyoxylase-like metal-dependent hydrolase (beta-lactamase superfamily II)